MGTNSERYYGKIVHVWTSDNWIWLDAKAMRPLISLFLGMVEATEYA